VSNLQLFLDTFVCEANKNGTGYFFFDVCPVIVVKYGRQTNGPNHSMPTSRGKICSSAVSRVGGACSIMSKSSRFCNWTYADYLLQQIAEGPHYPFVLIFESLR
jgi:hypothetical protein